MFSRNSERTTPKLKPKFPRFQFMEKKAKDDLRFYVDEEYMLHVVPCMHGKGKS